jgi:cell division protein FtsW
MLVFDAFQPSQARRREGPRGRYDAVLLLAIFALVSIGIVMVASASIAVADGRHFGAFYYLKRHLLFLGLGSVLAVIAMRVELKVVEKFSMPLMVLGMAAMLAVFVPGLGMRINGARRWLNLGASFQPVEAVKLIMIVYLASYLVRHKQAVEQKLFGTVNPLVVAGLLVISLLLQPDFGSSALIVAVTVGMIWLGGGRMRYLFGMAGVASLLMAAAAFSERYRVRRLMTFLDPWKDPYKDGFQLTQALIAIGRGEWTGVGLGESVQKLFYLPEAHTDFILAVIGEELGLVGIGLVLGLFAVLVGRGLWLGLRGVELGQHFAGYVAFGISLMIGLQALVSAGVNLGVLPTKGLTLPLISSGGSSVMMTCAMLGVLLRAGYEIHRAADTRNMAVRSDKARVTEEVGA